MGDHTEAISIDYDPEILHYADLLDRFWQGHRCERTGFGTQYRKAVFYRNEEQKKIAETSRAKEAERLGIPVTQIATEIVPIQQFTYAEGYHQKYLLGREHDLRAFLEEKYPDAKSLADSTVATRLNAFLGSGMEKNWARFLEELPEYGLPERLQERLEKKARREMKEQ